MKFFKDKISSKYTPKRTKLHLLKKFSRGSMPPNPPKKAQVGCIFLPNIIPPMFEHGFTPLVNKSSYEKEQLKLHQSLLGVKGGDQNQPSEQPSIQLLAVSLKINICRPNFS